MIPGIFLGLHQLMTYRQCSHYFQLVILDLVLSATLMSTNSYSTYHKEEYKDT